MWALYRFDKLFFLSLIDSSLVSFFVHSCEQSLSSCEDGLAAPCGTGRHSGLRSGGEEPVGGDGH